MPSNNSNTFRCVVLFVEQAQYLSDAQTKRGDDRPWCGDDVDALGLGAAMIWVMLGAISAPHHGRPIFCAYGASTEPYLEYVVPTHGLV